MLDNVTNNDTAVASFHSLLVNKYGLETAPISPTERRLRCMGHILNLAAKSLLFESDAEAFECETTELSDNDAAIEREFQHWRQAGSIGKIHNLVAFIHCSPQRKEAFCSIQLNVLKWPHSILPHTDNATRWNSVFLMLNDVLNFREPIELYLPRCCTFKTMDKKDKQQFKLERHCMLTDDDWEELIHLHALLYDFWELTLQMQGNVTKKLQEDATNMAERHQTVYGKSDEYIFRRSTSTSNSISTSTSFFDETSEDGTLFNVLPAFDHLLSKLETAKTMYTNDSRFTTSINLAWKKMDDYYNQRDLSKTYLVAAVLDPRVKL